MEGHLSGWSRPAGLAAAVTLLVAHGAAAGGSTVTVAKPPILATVPDGGELKLVRLDPTTLARLAGPAITVGRPLPAHESAPVWAKSQASGRLAILEHPRQQRMFVVDPGRMRLVRTLAPGSESVAFAQVAWAAGGRLLAAAVHSGQMMLIRFARNGAATEIGVEGYASLPAGGRFIFLGSTAAGSARVGVAGLAGFRSVAIRRIRARPETAPVKESDLTPEAGRALDSVRKQVSLEWDVPLADVKAESVSAGSWADSAMGCPKRGAGYLQMVTSGYRVVVSVRARYYDYRVQHRDVAPLYPAFCLLSTEPLDVGVTRPIVTVDAKGASAFVISPGAPVAEIALRQLTVRYHRIRIPAIGARAAVLSPGKIAVGGEPIKPRSVDAAYQSNGIFVVDVKRRTRRWINRQHGTFTTTAGRLWAFQRAAGLVAYDLDGREQFTMFASREVTGVQVANGYAYVRTFEYLSREEVVHVVDMSSRLVLQSRGGMRGVQLLIGPSGGRG